MMILKSPFEINWRLDGKLRLSEAQLGLISSKQMCQEQIGLDLKPEAMHNFFFVCSLNIIDPLALLFFSFTKAFQRNGLVLWFVYPKKYLPMKIFDGVLPWKAIYARYITQST